MSRAVIGVSNANLEADLRTLLDEIQGVDVVAVAPNTGRLVDFASRFEPDLIVVHETLGPEPSQSIIRDLTERLPATAIIQISPDRSSSTVIRALEAGARSVVAHPFAFEDVQTRVDEARDWSSRMRRVLEGAAESSKTLRGRVLTVVGAKGGVGVTTVAVHLALDHRLNHPTDKVCVVDLDIEKGDLGALVDIRHSVSVADLAKVHQDLSAGTVSDAVSEHESGIHMMLAPIDVRQSEAVTPEALRVIVTLLRREFDLVVVDAGGYVSPTQAAAIELANETLVVTTPDVLAVRALRRRILAWEALGVRQEAELRILVNKTDRSATFPADAVAKLTTGQVLTTRLPLAVRVLEPGVNERDPQAVTDVNWWKLIKRIRKEVGLDGLRQDPDAGQGAPKPSAKPRRSRHEAGSIALENVAVIPLVLAFVVAMWQLAAIGIGALWLGQASTEATRIYAVTGSVQEAAEAARGTLPPSYATSLTVAASGSTMQVSVDVPFGSIVPVLSSDHTVVQEPR